VPDHIKKKTKKEPALPYPSAVEYWPYRAWLDVARKETIQLPRPSIKDLVTHLNTREGVAPVVSGQIRICYDAYDSRIQRHCWRVMVEGLGDIYTPTVGWLSHALPDHSYSIIYPALRHPHEHLDSMDSHPRKNVERMGGFPPFPHPQDH